MFRIIVIGTLAFVGTVQADAPVAQYVFPAGGQRGTTVDVHVGGLYLNEVCQFELIGKGVKASARLQRVPSPFFEGPILPLPESQRQEDYPKAMAGQIEIAANADLGLVPGHVWTSQGVAATWPFVVGEFPEVIETESEGETNPVAVQTPVTVNGRMYPREDIDEWTFAAKAGQRWKCRAEAGRFGSPLVPHLELFDPQGKRIAESADLGRNDSEIVFTAANDGIYRIRIRDTNVGGSPAHVYRLTIVSFDPTSESTNSNPSVSSGKRMLPREGGQGCIQRPGQVDEWICAVRNGTSYDLILDVDRNQSRLLPILTLIQNGKEVGKLEQSGTLKIASKEAGELTIRVQERFSVRAGTDFAYSLRVVPSIPDFELTLPTSAITIPRGGEGKFKVNVKRQGGFTGPITLTVDGLPPDVRIKGSNVVNTNQPSIDLTFEADGKATIRSGHLQVRGTAWLPVHPLSSVARPMIRVGQYRDLAVVRYATAIPTPFKITGDYVLKLVPRGTVYLRKYRIERNGYDGPITIALADRQARHLQGAHGPTFVVPAGKNEFEYPTTLPPWMETGRTCRVCVMGTATVRDLDGSEHVVSYSSVQQNDQIIAVVEPGKLGLELGKASILAEPGSTVEIPVRIARSSELRGPVRVQMIVSTPAMAGITSDPITILADQTQGKIIVRFANDRAQLANVGVPMVIRATVEDGPSSVFAESKLEIVRLSGSR